MKLVWGYEALRKGQNPATCSVGWDKEVSAWNTKYVLYHIGETCIGYRWDVISRPEGIGFLGTSTNGSQILWVLGISHEI